MKYSIGENIISCFGYLNTVLCDLQLLNLVIVPNFYLKKILRSEIPIPVNEIKHSFKKSEINLFRQYLIENKFINKYRSDLIIKDFETKFSYNYYLLCSFSDNLNYSGIFDLPKYFNLYLQLNICGSEFNKRSQSIDQIELFLNELNQMSVVYLEIAIDVKESIYSLDKLDDALFSLIMKYSIDHVLLYNSILEKEFFLQNGTKISYSIMDLSNHLLCGNIRESNFLVSQENLINSFNFNSCLNRKIFIDVCGKIKNCPSMKESYGYIRDTTLAEALEKPGFKKYWDINKDKIHVCKDCEFRYICTDCRAYVEDPEDILSKPLKCGYNPYTGEWSDWSTNPLKQKAIDYYGMSEMVDEMNKADTTE